MKIRLYIYLLLIISTQIFSQETDLDNFYAKKISLHRNTNIDSLFFYTNKLENSKDICKKIEALSGRSYGYYKLKRYDETEDLVTKIIHKIDSIKNPPTCLINRKLAALNRLFWVKENQEKYEEAYKTIIEFEKLIAKYPDKNKNNFRDKLGLILNKADIKNKLNLPEDALVILYEAYSKAKNYTSEKNNNYFNQWNANMLNSFGNTYLRKYSKDSITKNLDSAAYYYKKAFQLVNSFSPSHKNSEIFYSFRKTEVLIAKEKYHEAIKEINKYSKISNGYHYHHREYFQKAICFNKLNTSDSAIYYAYKLLYNKKEKCRPSKRIIMYDILTKQYNNLNKVDSAFKYSQLTMKQYKLTKERKDKTFNLVYKNDYNQVKKLNSEIKQKEKDKQQNIIIAFFSLIVILGGFTLYKLKEEKGQKEKLTSIINNQSSIDTEKKEYNINEVLETKILNEIKSIDDSLEFLSPNFSATAIAEKLNTNSTYISFIFNKHHKESFKQYYTRLKIEYVVNKLNSNKNYRKYSIQALAEEVGYTNASAFTRAFKKQMKTTPSIYIKSLKD